MCLAQPPKQSQLLLWFEGHPAANWTVESNTFEAVNFAVAQMKGDLMLDNSGERVRRGSVQGERAVNGGVAETRRGGGEGGGGGRGGEGG